MDAVKKNLSHQKIMRSPEVCLSVLTVCVLAVSIAELCLGPQSYSLTQLWNAFAQQSAADTVWRVLAYVRIPRLLAGLLAGAALAVAGTLLQAVLNNAMASPNVIGVNSGAGFFALLAAALAPEALGAAQFASFLGALGCAMLVYGLARLTGLSRTTLVLSGLAVSGMFSAGINIVRLLWPESVSSAPSFLVGGLSGVTLKMLLLALPYLFTGAILAFWIDTDLNVLCLGDETASSLGLNVETIRFIGILAAALLAGAAQFASFLGALGCAMLVYGLARLTGLSRTTLVLSGLAVSGMFSAGINIVRLLWPESVSGAPNFLVGGLSGATLKMLLLALPYLFTGALLAFWIDTDLNVLCLGDETASSLGLNVETIRFIGILAAALLAGAAVSFAGLLSFVGLLAPHIARKIVGNDHRVLLPASALLGAFCVVGCDLPARLLFAPFELPVGILLSLIGGPFFLGLLLRHKGGRLYA